MSPWAISFLISACEQTPVQFPEMWAFNFFFFFFLILFCIGASLVAQTLKHLPEMQVQSLGQEDPLEKEMATHSSTLAWKIPWTEESGRPQSMGSQRVGHDGDFTQSINNVVRVSGEHRRDLAVHTHAFILSQTLLPSRLPCIALSRVPCASQQVLVGYVFSFFAP